MFLFMILSEVLFLTRHHGINPTLKLCSYSLEPCDEVYCLRLNFNASKLDYY